MDLASLARRRAPALSMLALAIVALACNDQVVDEKSGMLQSAARASMADLSAGAGGKDAVMAAALSSTSEVRPTAPPQPARSQAATGLPSMIIRNGDVSVQVDSLEAAMDAVRRLAASLGGYIGNVSINTGQYQVRSASLEMKIPANRFEEAMAGLKPLGKAEHSTATAQDIGEEFVDVTARIVNGKRLEARLINLLATRTDRLERVLAVERELARVREEIERYEGRIRYLSAHVATSTIVATVHEKVPLVASQPGRNPIGQAFVNMWRNFVIFLAWGIESLGVLIPVAAMALLLAKAWQRWRRTRVAAA